MVRTQPGTAIDTARDRDLTSQHLCESNPAVSMSKGSYRYLGSLTGMQQDLSTLTMCTDPIQASSPIMRLIKGFPS